MRASARRQPALGGPGPRGGRGPTGEQQQELVRLCRVVGERYPAPKTWRAAAREIGRLQVAVSRRR